MNNHQQVSAAIAADTETTNEYRQHSEQVTTDTSMTGKQEISSVQEEPISNALKALLLAYKNKAQEVKDLIPVGWVAIRAERMAWARANIYRQTAALNVHVIDLGSLDTLDFHTQFLSLQNEALKRTAEFHALAKAILTQILEVSTLEDDIRTNHPIELRELPIEEKCEFDDTAARFMMVRESFRQYSWMCIHRLIPEWRN